MGNGLWMPTTDSASTLNLILTTTLSGWAPSWGGYYNKTLLAARWKIALAAH